MTTPEGSKRRVLVISPHPDDEAIGCGGTIRMHVVHGDRVHVVFLTSGEKGGYGRSEAETATIREQEAETAAQILGIERIDFYREPDGHVRAADTIVARLRNKIVEWSPDRIYLPHDREVHPDHQAAVQVLQRAVANPVPSGTNTEIRMFEVWTPIQQIDEIVDISDYAEQKRAAIQAHASQCAVMRFDEAALALNRYRGEMHSWPGGPYAEVFTELRS